MIRLTKTMEDFSKNSSDYIDLKVTDVKLRTVKGLSLTLSRLLWMLLATSVVSVILIAAGFALILVLGDLLGSYALGAVIVAVVFLGLLALLFVGRDKLFRDTFVPLFVKIFFGSDNEEAK